MTTSLSGRHVGGFDIGPLVGAGGMGEVYRARDTRLNRDVAIKVLLPAVAGDGERLARFRREAQVLASLSHPNIAQIHGLEDGDSSPLLIMEFVGGPTLADRIAAGPLAIDDAVAIARQIADALEAAHERGIIHRDLKPANIKVDDHGTVKILDFGLAKALDLGAGSGEPGAVANSPTITSPAMTQAGMILGTAAYMSPEQAKGRAVDKRSDVWAFGCVLYEMLTGRRAFDGEDVTDTIAAVVRGDANWAALPAGTPAQIRQLLHRALDKDRRTRMSDISVARFLMNETVAPLESGAVASRVSGSRRVVAAALGGVLTGAVLAAGVWWLRDAGPPPAAPARFTITPPSPQSLVPQGNDHDVAMAPDGSFVVYRSGDSSLMQRHLAIRVLNELEPRILPGTENARYPFISADGRWVGFQVGGEMRRVAVAGGSVMAICRVGGAPRGASWGDDDFIVFGAPTGLMRVPAAGGEPVALTKGDGEQHQLPHVLPGSKWVVFTAFHGAEYLRARLEAVEIATGRRKAVLPIGHDAAYLESGHLVFANQSPDADSRFRAVLHAVRFDPAQVEVSGAPISVLDGVRVGPSPTTNYSVSRRGDLVFLAGTGLMNATPDRTLVWVDRKGQESDVGAPPRAYAMARISPDGTRLALDLRDQTNDVWIWDLTRRTLSLLNRHPAQDMSPIWTPDGKRIVWTSTRGGGNPNLFWQSADGTGSAERLTTSGPAQFPTALTSDGKTILVFGGAQGNPANASDLFRIDMTAAERVAKALIPQSGAEFGAELSPDGKWLVYHTNESGEFQVYVRPFPNVQDGRWQISTSGGTRATWSRDGRELFYLDADGFLTAVAVPPPKGAAFVAGTPVKILNAKYYAGSSLLGLDLRGYDVAADGRFLMIKEPGPASGAQTPSSMTVVLNWSEELKQRLPAR